MRAGDGAGRRHRQSAPFNNHEDEMKKRKTISKDNNGGPPAAMTIQELLELLAGEVSDATLETVPGVLHSILDAARFYYVRNSMLTESAVAIAFYAVGGIDEWYAKEILSHIESLTDDMADLKGLSPTTRHLCEAIADLIGPEFNELVTVPPSLISTS
jgi:hypothetical protein